MCATVPSDNVQITTEQPICAAAHAASTPACPAPITATSTTLSNQHHVGSRCPLTTARAAVPSPNYDHIDNAINPTPCRIPILKRPTRKAPTHAHTSKQPKCPRPALPFSRESIKVGRGNRWARFRHHTRPDSDSAIRTIQSVGSTTRHPIGRIHNARSNQSAPRRPVESVRSTTRHPIGRARDAPCHSRSHPPLARSLAYAEALEDCAQHVIRRARPDNLLEHPPRSPLVSPTPAPRCSLSLAHLLTNAKALEDCAQNVIWRARPDNLLERPPRARQVR